MPDSKRLLENGSPPEQAVALDARATSTRGVVQSLRVIFRAIQEHSRWVEKQCGVSATQLWVMWELFAEPGQRVSQLSQVLSIHPSTASNLLDKLERKALVRRERAGPDQRVVRLYLTDSGAALLGHAPRPAQGALTDALLRQSDQVLAELDADLARLVAAMRVKDESAALQPLSGS